MASTASDLVQCNDGFRTQLIGTPEQVARRIVDYWIAITALNDDEQLVAAFVRREAEGVTVDED